MKIKELFEAGGQESEFGLNFDGPSGNQDLALARVFRSVIMSKKYMEELLQKYAKESFSGKKLSKSFMQNVVDFLESGVRMIAKGAIARDVSILSAIKDKRELDEIKSNIRDKFKTFSSRGVMEGGIMEAIFEMHMETIRMLLSRQLGQSYTQVIIDTYGKAVVFETIGAELRSVGLLEEHFTDPEKPLLESTRDI
jgi:hypothetical protein